MLIDTHAHLWFDDFSQDLESVLARAKVLGLGKIIVPGTDVESSKKAIELARKYPGIMFAACGVHPEETTVDNFTLDIDELEKLIKESHKYIVAIGEIGIDLFTEEVRQKLDIQKELFKSQLLLANKLDLPVIIHTRNSFNETWEVLNSLPKTPRGQFHCFSIDEDAIHKVLDRDFYISFGGNITWSKRVARLVSKVPDNRLLLETDSPLMVPRDSKGLAIGESDRNEPSNVKYLADKIAELRGQTPSEIEEITTINANMLYKL